MRGAAAAVADTPGENTATAPAASVENSRPQFEPLNLAALGEEAVITQAPLVYRSGRTIELIHHESAVPLNTCPAPIAWRATPG